VNLTRTGEPNVTGTGAESTSSTEMTVDFDLSGAKAGWWDLSVSNPDLGDAFLPHALAIKQAPTIERISAWGGPVQAMEVRDREVGGQMRRLGYVARGSGMVILDVTDPTNMIELSSLDLESSGVFDIAVQGDYAYVGGYDIGLSIVDVSDPSSPRLVATRINPSPGHETTAPAILTEVTVFGSAAYLEFGGVRNRDGAGYILDISDPEGLASNSPSFSRFVWRVYTTTVVGDLLYAVVIRTDLEDRILWRQLHIYDLSGDPLSPALLGAAPLLLDTSFDTSRVAVDGDFAYVTAYRTPTLEETRLVIVNISNPQSPHLNGVFSDLTRANDVGVSNGIAYIADFEDGRWPWYPRTARGLVAVDVSDPFNPTSIGNLNTQTPVFGLTLAGTTAYLFDRSDGLVAVDVTDPANPVRLSNWHSPAFTKKIDSEGDTLFFSDQWHGVTALDVSDPGDLVFLGAHRNANTRPGWGGYNAHVRVQNGFAYLAAGFNGLEVVDFTNPTDPTLIYVYQAAEEGFAPIHMARTLEVKDYVLLVGGRDEVYYVGEWMWTFDVSDPATPALGAADHLCSQRDDWAITDDFLAIGVWKFGYWPGLVRDVSDPFNPVTLFGECPESLFLQGVDVAAEGRRLYSVNDDSAGPDGVRGHLFIYEIPEAEPKRPYEVAQFDIIDASAVAVQDGIAYVTGQARKGTNVFGSATFHRWSLNIYGVANLEHATTTSNLLAVGSPTRVDSLHAKLPYIFASGNAAHGVGTGMVTFRVTTAGSLEVDGDRDLADFAGFQSCFGDSPGVAFDRDCTPFDFDHDGDVDGGDLGAWQGGMTGPM